MVSLINYNSLVKFLLKVMTVFSDNTNNKTIKGILWSHNSPSGFSFHPPCSCDMIYILFNLTILINYWLKISKAINLLYLLTIKSYNPFICVSILLNLHSMYFFLVLSLIKLNILIVVKGKLGPRLGTWVRHH